MPAVLKLEVNWSHYQPGGSHPAQALLDRLHRRLQSLEHTKSLGGGKSLASGECTYVYGACGSCDDGIGARVEAYCSGNGDSTPDYVWCEDC